MFSKTKIMLDFFLFSRLLPENSGDIQPLAVSSARDNYKDDNQTVSDIHSTRASMLSSQSYLDENYFEDIKILNPHYAFVTKGKN